MLAYLFWHRPRSRVEPTYYEDRLRAFHTQLGQQSASFRVAPLPFSASDGYEDWYLAPDWAEVGALNATAVSGDQRRPHDSIAELTARGWGGVYALVRGNPAPPQTARWLDKPPGTSHQTFLESLPQATVWHRQMVLGPAPEFCLVESNDTNPHRDAPSRAPIYPPTTPSTASSSRSTA